MSTLATGIERRRLSVSGQVQGVGFRPFIFRIASAAGLAGWVRNTGFGLELEVEGPAAAIRGFVRRLSREPPRLAHVHRIRGRRLPATGLSGFAILASDGTANETAAVVADVATCAACLSELGDPADRRFRYPFANCTDCGPRFTIVETLPYDRERTTMRRFALCEACRREYEDPSNRRFHAEPVACPRCGPELVLRTADERALTGEAALAAAIALLRRGRIVALKAIGGFQLACAAMDAGAVRRLRARKARASKPFAVMVADLAGARELCRLGRREAQLLAGPAAPIVLLRRRREAAARLAGVAPGLDVLGVMLPSSPLHHLLLAGFGGPLVMTSGNRSEEPIAAGNDEALTRLSDIADAILLHDRDIVVRCDDSVARVERGAPVLIRRARGYTPEPLQLPRRASAAVLATGAQLKNTFCLLHGDRAFASPHIGDLGDALTRAHYASTLEHYRRLLGIEPEIVAHDLHPDCPAAAIGRAIGSGVHVPVQHHHAHVVSCMAEHGWTEPVIGVALDGHGFGPDGAVWGGELMVADWRGFHRAAHLAYLRLPGGDAAAREPWRMALAAVALAFGNEAENAADRLLARIPIMRRRAVLGMVRSGLRAPLTSSAGRVFDAVASLAGICDVNTHEGHAAMLLESRAAPGEAGAYPLPLVRPVAADGSDAPAVWDTAVLVRAVSQDLVEGVDAGVIAARFHNGLAAALAAGCRELRRRLGHTTVVLSGGCFQNRRLTARTHRALTRSGFRVLTHRWIPCNDGGLSLGQAAVALAST